MNSPLEALLVSEDALHDDLLTRLLEKYISLTTTGDLVFNAVGRGLPVREKALVGVLGAMALYRLGKRSTGGVSPKDLELLTGLAGGTLRPALRELVRGGLLRSTKGTYEVPAYAIDSVRASLIR